MKLQREDSQDLRLENWNVNNLRKLWDWPRLLTTR